MGDEAATQKQCLYEVLEVERTASVDEIRVAYRKQALRWHPDKIQQSGASLELCREATERFQAISRAYEVLGDPVERAWYDSHRSAILSEGGEGAEFEFNLWPYFSPSAFSGFGDTGKGFYAVYSGVFAQLFKQEQMFARAYGSGSVTEAPAFGGPKSSYAEVAVFYNYWLGFKTVKDFSWCDEYRLSEAPNRKVRRIMEEENKKIRKGEQREFNEAVRQLAAFVKKRDRRVMERQVEMQRIQKEKELAQKLKREQLEREKLSRMKEYREQEWSKVEIDDEEVINGYDWDESQKEQDERQEFYCIICEKRFKSHKQWQNHEKSKKHIERASALKDSFLEEDQQLQSRNAASEEEHQDIERESALKDSLLEGERQPQRRYTSFESATNGKNAAVYEEGQDTRTGGLVGESTDSEDGNGEDDDESSLLAAMLDSHRNRSHVDRPDGSETGSFSDDAVDFADGNEASDHSESKPSKRKSKLEKQREAISERHAAIEAEVSTLGNMVEHINIDKATDEQADAEEAEEQPVQSSASKKSRRKGKKAEVNKSTKADIPHVQAKKTGKSKKGKAAPSSTCEVCGQDFESRNLLFKHMDSTKHFALK